MTLTDLIWLSTACYGLHILEEYQLDWRGWARTALRLPVEWSDFYVFGWREGSRESAVYTRKARRAVLAKTSAKMLMLPKKSSRTSKKVRESGEI